MQAEDKTDFAPRKHFRLWIPVIVPVLPMVAFLAFHAVSDAADTEAAALASAVIAILLGTHQAYLLYRSGERAVVSRTEAASLPNAEYDHLTALMDTMPFGFIEADQAGRLTYVNKTLAGWFGCTPSELIGGNRHLGDILVVPSKSCYSGRIDEFHEDKIIDVTRDTANIKVVLLDGARPIFRASFTRTIILQDGAPGFSRSALWNAQPIDDDQQGNITGFKRLFEASPVSLALIGGDGRMIESNRMFRDLVGGTRVIIKGEPFINIVDKADRVAVDALLKKALDQAGNPPPLDIRIGPMGGIFATLFAARLDNIDGLAISVMLHLIDTTEQKNLDLQFAQSQKMQAVGQLASGIAHDFGNLLTAIMGFCDLLLLRHQAGNPSFTDLMQIKQNANRAASLVRQLLAFSRRQALRPKVLALTDVLAGLTNLLRCLIGEDIYLNMVHSRNLWLVKIDQGRIEQVIINLAVNARDAMTYGGKLTIRSSNFTHNAEDEIKPKLLAPGDYVLIEVRDTGIGIEKKFHDKLFESFFTTKETGTGLGLSIVYGIIKQTGGYIFVESVPGEGTDFSIYLPRHFSSRAEAVETSSPTKRPVAQDLAGKGTILLVEDEDGVRVFSARAMRDKGYTVIEADSGEAALAVIASFEGSIDLLITDMAMPRMDGATLIERVRESHPDFKAILISGYAEDSFRERTVAAGDIIFLPKPFSLAQLASTVKSVIET